MKLPSSSSISTNPSTRFQTRCLTDFFLTHRLCKLTSDLASQSVNPVFVFSRFSLVPSVVYNLVIIIVHTGWIALRNDTFLSFLNG
jgi:hypothetical protein